MCERFTCTEADIGRYVRRKSTGEIGVVRRDPGNGWVHPGVVYEWRAYLSDLEYVTVTADDAAELAEAHHLGWIAGRDAALEIAREQVTICDADIDEGDLLSQFYREGASRCCDAIRNMEPPA